MHRAPGVPYHWAVDTVFLITILMIFVSTLVGAFIKRRSCDRCLKDLARDRVTVQLKDGKQIWGRLAVFPNALEILYPTPHLDSAGHEESSYIVLHEQMAGIQAIYRFHDELTESAQNSRRRDIGRTYRPSLARRARRRCRNIFNTFRDAFGQSIGVVISQAKKSSQGAMLSTQDGRLSQIGQTILSAAGSAYEPVLERYIGRKVIAEESRDGKWVEHPGILKEYTAGWIELLDCRMVGEHRLGFCDPGQLRVNRNLDFVVRLERGEATVNLHVHVTNNGPREIALHAVEAGEFRREFDLAVKPGADGSFEIDDLPASLWEGVDLPSGTVEYAFKAGHSQQDSSLPRLPDIALVIQADREVDVLLPRSVGLVRHAGERA